MRRIKTYINKSTDSRLLAGQRYSLKELSTLTGVPKGTLHGRLHYKESFTDKEVRPSERAIVWPILETNIEKLSAKWITRRIVNV